MEAKDQNHGEKYRSRIRNLPSGIRRNGLLQSLSGLAAEGESSAEGRLAADLCEWFHKAMQLGWMALPCGADGQAVIPQIPTQAIGYLCGLPAIDYLYVTKEAILISSWLKRAGEAILPDPPRPVEAEQPEQDEAEKGD